MAENLTPHTTEKNTFLYFRFASNDLMCVSNWFKPNFHIENALKPIGNSRKFA